jgi:two-component system CheB/CheR fusion protein
VDITLGDFQFEGRPALVVTAYDITEREKAKRDRQELLRQLVTIQEEESRRISRELHDHMGQSLTALILGIKSVEDMLPSTSPARKSLQQLKEIADELGQEAHRLAFELRPAALDDLGLHTTLMNYAEEWAERTKIKVDYQATGLKEERFASPIETTIYRIVQEALTNIVKHANASNVSILLDRQPKLIQAIVEDDGCGLEPDEVFKVKGERRFGLIGMKERAELAGGTFHIESEAKKGTTIFVRIPLEI